jgi:hypothetical protein
MSAQILLDLPNGASIDGVRTQWSSGVAHRSKRFSEAIYGDAILVRPGKQR